MITGYNTDVKHRGTVFHVQTEDKGMPAAWVETLIFVGGMVVARRKKNYQELVDGEPSQRVIGKMLEDQHRSMIAEIRQGSFDQQFEELSGLAKEVSDAPAAPVAPIDPSASEVAAPTTEGNLSPELALERISPEPSRESAPEVAEVEEPKEEALPIKPPAEIGSSPSEASLSLDEVILDYLTTEEEQEHLRLVMDSDDDLILGREVKFAFRTVSDPGGRPILGASVLINFISTVAEPLLLAEGQTDQLGTTELSVALPAVRKGKGALIITAKSPLGNAEIKHLL
jgi:hypothetical protein